MSTRATAREHRRDDKANDGAGDAGFDSVAQEGKPAAAPAPQRDRQQPPANAARHGSERRPADRASEGNPTEQQPTRSGSRHGANDRAEQCRERQHSEVGCVRDPVGECHGDAERGGTGDSAEHRTSDHETDRDGEDTSGAPHEYQETYLRPYTPHSQKVAETVAYT